MAVSELRIARDYNRGLAAPIRWAHRLAAAIRAAMRPVWAWAEVDQRRAWAVPLVWGAVGLALLLPLDGTLTRLAEWINPRLGGDPRRELHALQQYGQFTVSVLVALLVWLADPKNRARLLGWLVSWAIAAAIVYPMKLAVGRVRPRFGDGLIEPYAFLGPFGAWPMGVGRDGEPRGVRHAWELWGGISSDLHAMPSSHTAYAVVMSLFLSRLYPTMRPVLIGLAALVGVCRVLFGAHYATDVVVGAAAGAIAVRLAMDAGWTSQVTRWFNPRPISAPAGPSSAGARDAALDRGA